MANSSIVAHHFLSLTQDKVQQWADYCQYLWTSTLYSLDADEFQLYTYGSIFVAVATYWTLGLFYLLVDIFHLPKWIIKYKRPETSKSSREILTMRRIMTTIGVVLFNQFVISVPLAVLGFRILEWRGLPDLRILPSLAKHCTDFIIIQIVREAAFYYGHRFLHNRHVYRHIHKRHHEWSSPIAIAAVYCHPIEFIVTNVWPLIAGVILVRSHLITNYLVLFSSSLHTVNDHSGYHFVRAQSAQFHDHHHKRLHENFGLYGWFDYLHGTDAEYRAQLANKILIKTN